MAQDRIDPYLPGTEHENTYKNVYFSDMPAMIRLLEEFGRTHMHDWTKQHEEIAPNGLSFTCQYRKRDTKTWLLRHNSALSRIQTGIREASPVAAVPYELECELSLRAEPPYRIHLTLHARERIDPNRSVKDYPIGYDFLAPSLLYEENYFGAKLDPFLISRLIGP
jgi:hypothetical protein